MSSRLGRDGSEVRFHARDDVLRPGRSPSVRGARGRISPSNVMPPYLVEGVIGMGYRGHRREPGWGHSRRAGSHVTKGATADRAGRADPGRLGRDLMAPAPDASDAIRKAG